MFGAPFSHILLLENILAVACLAISITLISIHAKYIIFSYVPFYVLLIELFLFTEAYYMYTFMLSTLLDDGK